MFGTSTGGKALAKHKRVLTRNCASQASSFHKYLPFHASKQTVIFYMH